jgi:PDZ domain-containing secreted protein
MRKYVAYGAAALLVLSGGASALYAQDATETATPTQQVVIQTTWLGVSVKDDGTGVTITRVAPGSPAETAQLQVGDVITSVNGAAVDTAGELRAIIDVAASGDVVSLSVTRGTDAISVEVTLAARTAPGNRGTMTFPTDPLQAAELVLHAQLEAVDGGYQVVSVDGRNQFQLAVGDVITQVNDADITSVDWQTLLTPSTDNTNTVTLTATRDGAATTLEGQFGGFGRRGNGQPGGFPGNSNGPRGNRNNGQPGGGLNDNNGLPGGNNGQPAVPLSPGNGGQPGAPLTPGNGGQPAAPTGAGGGSI